MAASIGDDEGRLNRGLPRATPPPETCGELDGLELPCRLKAACLDTPGGPSCAECSLDDVRVEGREQGKDEVAEAVPPCDGGRVDGVSLMALSHDDGHLPQSSATAA